MADQQDGNMLSIHAANEQRTPSSITGTYKTMLKRELPSILRKPESHQR